MTVGGARTLRAFHRFMRATSGVSAIEFALIVPILALMLVAMLEIGRGIQNRMMIDSVLRAGAHVAMQPGRERSEIEEVMSLAARARSGADEEEDIDAFVARFAPPPQAIPRYACPEGFDGTANPLASNPPDECDDGPGTHYTFYEIEVRFEHRFLILPDPDRIIRLPGLRNLDLSNLSDLSTSMLVHQPPQ